MPACLLCLQLSLVACLTCKAWQIPQQQQRLQQQGELQLRAALLCPLIPCK
jgi:hypothetical protein